MTTRPERMLIGGGILVVAALIGLTAYLGYQQVTNARAEEVAAATRMAGAAQAPTAPAGPAPVAQPTSSPAAGAPPVASPAPSPVATPVPSPTARPAASPTAAATASPPTIAAATATARPTEEGRYLGRDPLPPGVDLTNGPYLKEMKARGAKGARVGDGGLGDELKASYLAALKVEERALNEADPAQIEQFFTGEALTDLSRRVERRRTSTRDVMTIVVYEPRVMEFMPETTVAGVYEVVDARTETISTVERLPDGKPGRVTNPGQPERVCYSVQMAKEAGRWKIESQEATQGGAQGGRCPPYWS